MEEEEGFDESQSQGQAMQDYAQEQLEDNDLDSIGDFIEHDAMMDMYQDGVVIEAAERAWAWFTGLFSSS